MKDHHKTPRIYVDHSLQDGGSIALCKDHSHYLVNVMRKREDDHLRVFNGKDGEFLAKIIEASKKNCVIKMVQQVRAQPESGKEFHLLFAPIKKARMDWLIEKAVELGVTHFHPVLTQNTEVRTLNTERIHRQIIEAAEQCERLNIPVFNEPEDMMNVLSEWKKDIPLYVCMEHEDVQELSKVLDKEKSAAFLIGPEGGFTEEEKIKLKRYQCVSLGPNILRAETAAIKCLSLI